MTEDSVNLYVFSSGLDGSVDAMYSPTGGLYGDDGKYKDLPQHGYDDMEFLRTPYLVIPRLSQYAKWFLVPNKNTNWWLFWQDPTVQMLKKLMDSLILGDDIKAKVFDDFDLTNVNQKYTDVIHEWLRCPVGASTDNRGKTISSWVIPMITTDCIIAGASAWYKYIGTRGKSRPEEIGKLMLKWLDPRSYVKVFSEFFGWSKLTQFRRVQFGTPTSLKEFERWHPSIRNMYQNVSSTGPTQELVPVDIPSDKYYWFNLFIRPPMNAIAQTIISKIILRFLEDRFLEKATYPFFVVKVPRNALRDANEAKFQEKLQMISKLIAQYRAGDCIAVEGKEYQFHNGEAIQLSEGWEIEIIEVAKGAVNFSETIRQLDSQIAYGLYTSISAMSPMGVQGRTTTLSTGGQIGSNINQIIRQLRLGIASTFRYILQDVIKQETGDIIDLRLIDISFSKIREEDAAQFLNQIISLHGAGMMLTNEGRHFADRIGMDLPPLPIEMTPEGQMALQLDAMLDQVEPAIPKSFLDITAGKKKTEMEEVRDDIEKSKEMQKQSDAQEKEKQKSESK